MNKVIGIIWAVLNALLVVVLMATGILEGLALCPTWLYFVAGFYTLAVLVFDSVLQINFIKNGKVTLFGKKEE